MTDETKAVLKTELGWAVKALVIALSVIFSLLGAMWLSIGSTLSEIKGEVRELRSAVQGNETEGITRRAELSNRITRLETRLDVDP